MADVKWIKLKVGMFDGESFKKIKRAKIGGEKFRDKLTAVWFELMDFAGKCNHGGAFINSREIPFTSIDDIATMIDRETEELQICMSFFVNEGMVAIIDDVYMLSNWAEYQNDDRLKEIREQNRLRKQRQREREKLLQAGNVTDVTCDERDSHAIDIDKDIDIDKEKDIRESIPADEPPAAPSSRIPYESIRLLYNEICVSFPRCQTLSEARKKAIKARFTSGKTYEDFQTLFVKAEASSFLKGKNDRNWQANFDWLIKDANMAKVMDGNYDDNKGANTNGSSGVNPEPRKRYGTYL